MKITTFTYGFKRVALYCSSIFFIVLTVFLILFFIQNQPNDSFRFIKSTKQTLPTGTSFLMDSSKIYVYQTTKYKIKMYDGKKHTWQFKNGNWYDGNQMYGFTEEETGLRGDDAARLISYPVTIGKKWYIEDDECTLVAIYDEMKTPAGTFQTVVEVSQSNQEQTKIAYRHFYAENIGLIRTETGHGKVLSALIELK